MEQQPGTSATILIVDDFRPTRVALRDLLARELPAYQLIEAGSAEEALELCRARAPHVVIMDIALPRMNGIEATRRILELHPLARVVMHSHHDSQIFREESAAAGASAFVPKTAVSTELVPAIVALLADRNDPGQA